MNDFHYEGDIELLEKLQNNFAGKIVRKDLTKRIKLHSLYFCGK